MDKRENLVDWFIKGTFFNKSYNGKEFNMFSTNKEDILLAVKKAYIDMTPRTIKGLADIHNKTFNEAFDNILSELADRFINYFKSAIKSETEFDNWHKDVCEKFQEDFNNLLENYNKETSQISYGKAQKIVNMTFKYIYCFDNNINSDYFSDYFKYCHMTLDSYTLNWFLEDVRNWVKENNDFKFNKKEIHAWSNLREGNYNDKFSYLWIQTQIRAYLKQQTKYPTTPFYAEFIIWQEEKAKALQKEKEKKQ